MTIGIVGLGLIGGSLAKTLSQRSDHTVLGFDISEEIVNAALADRAISAPLDILRPEPCGLAVLALTPETAVSTAQKLFPLLKKGTIVTDICGIKRFVCPRLTELALENGLRYVGGHPMAGIEKSGYFWSKPDMFDGASMVLCPTESSDDGAVELLSRLWLSVGFGKIRISDPDEHDAVISYTSQLAHLVSSAYIKSPTAAHHAGLAGGSFKDMTRVAMLDEKMWTELFFENRDNLLDETDRLIQRLTTYRDALAKGDRQTMCALLRDGRLTKQRCDAAEEELHNDGK